MIVSTESAQIGYRKDQVGKETGKVITKNLEAIQAGQEDGAAGNVRPLWVSVLDTLEENYECNYDAEAQFVSTDAQEIGVRSNGDLITNVTEASTAGKEDKAAGKDKATWRPVSEGLKKWYDDWYDRKDAQRKDGKLRRRAL